jgi:hypothetical protein
MLEAWLLDESGWPAERTLAMFREWFDVEQLSSVENLSPEMLDEFI